MARGLLAGHLAASPADERVTLVETLGEGLSGEDAGFLVSLATDRSERLRKVAAQRLARLGRAGNDPLAGEAASMFELATELVALQRCDRDDKPEGCVLSSRAVVTYVLGGTAQDSTAISAMDVGARRLSRRRSRPWQRTGRCFCWACPERQSPGCRNILPRPSLATARWWCNAPRARTRT